MLCERTVDDANLCSACKWVTYGFVGEFVVLGSHLLPVQVCVLDGALRKYCLAFCFPVRRGLCTGFRLKVSSGKGGRKPVGSRSRWGDMPKVKLWLRATKPEQRLG